MESVTTEEHRDKDIKYFPNDYKLILNYSDFITNCKNDNSSDQKKIKN